MSAAIAIDAMGGDYGPSVTVPASVNLLKTHPEIKIFLVGLKDQINQVLDTHSGWEPDRLKVVSASEVVGMDESPAQALRGKKDSSMRVAINLVKEGQAQACVCAGNTGALMATSRFVLKTLPGIDRPAIVSKLPRIRGSVHVLDLGANVDSPAELLLQFGIMGATLVKFLESKPNPIVRLLNIGIEDIKGNNVIKHAAELFRQSGLNYQGFIEGDALYTGKIDADVIVCDGFVGNVALKTSEGLAQMITTIMREEFTKSIFTKMSGLACKSVLNSFKQRVDHRRYNGATLLGLQGTVIKSHGGADELAFQHAILEAYHEVKHNVPAQIHEELSALTH